MTLDGNALGEDQEKPLSRSDELVYQVQSQSTTVRCVILFLQDYFCSKKICQEKEEGYLAISSILPCLEKVRYSNMDEAIKQLC